MKQRCRWAQNENDQLMIDYHDFEYGEMILDNDKFFELLCLEIMQTGLSWKIVLDKRIAFNTCFCNFIIDEVAKFDDNDIIELLENKDIIRHRLKLQAIIHNAKLIKENRIYLPEMFKAMHSIYGNDFMKCVKHLKKDGFKFIGPSVIESLYQAIGLIEGHDEHCFKYKKLAEFR